MTTFKDIAYQILKEAGEPLHYKEITKRALADNNFKTGGETPEFTMHASLNTDIRLQKEKSRFKKDRAIFSINPKFKETGQDKISSKQKGDIAEARIAELITLYGEETSLSCYKPISDDDGIDFIVKEKGSLNTMYIQVKSRFGDGPSEIYTASIKETAIINDKHMAMVFCYFDTEKGDLGSVWFVPAPDFIKKANKGKDGRLGFVAGQKPGKESNKWNSYLEEKHQLAERIISQMAKNDEEKNKR